MKYIVYERGGVPYTIIFPDHLVHYDVAAKALGEYHRPMSAGFCIIKDGTWVCTGKSESLNLESKGELDAYVLNVTTGIRPGM